jgi:tetratricopeptide (TPR) repeat protein
LERDVAKRASAKDVLMLLKKEANELDSKIQDGLEQLALVEKNEKNTAKNGDVLYSLGKSYLDKQDFKMALKYFLESLDIRRKVYKTEHFDIGMTLNYIGWVYDENSDYDSALKYYKECLDIWKKIYNSDHALIATCLSNIGLVYKKKE